MIGSGELKASLIIPTYNKSGRLKLVIESLKYQSANKNNFEIIIVDDGSYDETETYLRTLQLDLDWRWIRQKNNGRAYARNVGVKLSKYDLLIFTDDDLILDSNFIDNHIHKHKEKKYIVHGRIMNLAFTKFLKDPINGTFMDNIEIRDSIRKAMLKKCITPDMICKEKFSNMIEKKAKMTEMEQIIQKLLKDYPGKADWISAVGGNLSLPKNMFESVGGFDENFGLSWGCEDVEFGYRLMKAGYVFCYMDEAVNYHIAHFRKGFAEEHNKNLQFFYMKYKDNQILNFQDFVSEKITKQEFIQQILMN